MAVQGAAVQGADTFRVALPGEMAPSSAAGRAAQPDAGRSPGADGAGAAAAPGSFGEALVRALDAVDGDVKGGDQLVTKAVRGESVETHQLMMALEKADLSVRLMTQVGRRAVDAYREIMRMNV